MAAARFPLYSPQRASVIILSTVAAQVAEKIVYLPLSDTLYALS